MGFSFYYNASSRAYGLGWGLLLMACLLSGLGCSREEAPARAAFSEPVLRIGTTMVVKQANPVADYYYNILAMVMTHDSLVRFDENLNPVPQLAVKFRSDKKARGLDI